MTKIAAVTGAGAGLCRATVEEFARESYDVMLLVRFGPVRTGGNSLSSQTEDTGR